MVNVYTKPGCPQCVRTMRLMGSLGIEYDVVDVTEDLGALDKVKNVWGFTQVPVVETDDDVWSGFRPERIKEIGR